MDTTESQFNDVLNFLSSTNNTHMDFVIEIHEKLKQMGCKVKFSTTKAYPHQLAYTMPNSRKGILNFYLRKKGLKVRVTIVDASKHSDILNSLPEVMVKQINKKNECRIITDGNKCLESCTGFDFYIGETHYSRCHFDCFQFDVDDESIPFFFKLLDGEIEARKS